MNETSPSLNCLSAWEVVDSGGKRHCIWGEVRSLNCLSAWEVVDSASVTATGAPVSALTVSIAFRLGKWLIGNES